jgi:hypothetical protein
MSMNIFLVLNFEITTHPIKKIKFSYRKDIPEAGLQNPKKSFEPFGGITVTDIFAGKIIVSQTISLGIQQPHASLPPL